MAGVAVLLEAYHPATVKSYKQYRKRESKQSHREKSRESVGLNALSFLTLLLFCISRIYLQNLLPSLGFRVCLFPVVLFLNTARLS